MIRTRTLGAAFNLLFSMKKYRTCSKTFSAAAPCFSPFVVYISKCGVVSRIQCSAASPVAGKPTQTSATPSIPPRIPTTLTERHLTP